MAAPLVIDLSHHNPTPNWQQIKVAGVVGIIHKATEGTSFVDEDYEPRRQAAIAAGLSWSSYHFLKHGSVPQQMQHYAKTANAGIGDRLIVDFEDTDCTFTDLEDAVQWLFANTDCEVTVYGSNHLVDSVAGKTSPILSKTSLWQARYNATKEPDVPTNIWPTWSLWQYTDKAIVPGISKPVDGNKWNGDPDKLPLWFSNKAVEPEPGPEPVPPAPQPEPAKSVSIDITTPAGVAVAITVNGVKHT